MVKYTNLVFILGTKAQFIKTLPVLNNLNDEKIPINIIDTGQHRLTTSSQIKELKFDFNYESISKNEKDISSVGTMVVWFFKILTKILFSSSNYKKSICILHGDTASTLLGLIWAKKNNSLTLHIESGWRSKSIFKPFPERLIHAIIEKFSDILVPDGEVQLKNIMKYKDSKKIIYVEKNTIIDSIIQNFKNYDKKINNNLVITIHRTENIFNQQKIDKLCDLIEAFNEKKIFDEIIWYCHTPTFKILKKKNFLKRLETNGVEIKKLISHSEFLQVISSSKCVLTDGGGVVQESAFLNVPVIIWRKEIETYHEYKDNDKLIVSDYDHEIIFKFLKGVRSEERIPPQILKSPSKIISNEIVKMINTK